MVGVVLVMHGKLGHEMLATAEIIVGKMELARSVEFDPNDSVEVIREKMATAFGEVDSGDGVLVLTDMFGGTPANIALSFLEQRQVEVVTGCNLPMLLKLGSALEKPGTVADLAAQITTYGQKNIVHASGLLAGPRRETAQS